MKTKEDTTLECLKYYTAKLMVFLAKYGKNLNAVYSEKLLAQYALIAQILCGVPTNHRKRLIDRKRINQFLTLYGTDQVKKQDLEDVIEDFTTTFLGKFLSSILGFTTALEESERDFEECKAFRACYGMDAHPDSLSLH